MARGSGVGHLFVAATFAAASTAACVHRTHTEEIVVTRSPSAASVRMDPPAEVRDRRPASETVVLEYESRGMARAPFVIGGIVAMLGGIVLTGGSVVAAGAADEGLPPPVIGAMVGGLLTMVGGGVLLAYGAGHEHTVEPRTYTFDVEAPGYAPLRREVTVPRETDDWLQLELVPSSTATAGDALNLQLAPISLRDGLGSTD